MELFKRWPSGHLFFCVNYVEVAIRAGRMLRKCHVTAFIDWNSQTYNAGVKRELVRSGRGIDSVIQYIANTIDSILSKNKEWDRYEVDIRLYYGWHAGLTKTKCRSGIEELAAAGGLPASRGRCTFNWSCPFGDKLLSALDRRLHRKVQLHLPDTLRDDAEGNGREKMVDTALVADLLSVTRGDSQGWKIILAEDDDVIPGLLVAEKWSSERGGRCILARKRAEMGHLRIDELLHVLGG